MKNRYRILAAAAGALSLAVLFQNCAPQNFSDFDSSSVDEGQGVSTLSFSEEPRSIVSISETGNLVVKEVGVVAPTPPKNPSPPRPSTPALVAPTPPKNSSPANPSTPALVPAPAVNAPGETGPQIYVLNSYIGAEAFKVGMSSVSLPTFENYFPYPKSSKVGTFTFSDELWLASDRSLASSTVDICISESYSGCSRSSDFRKASFGAFNIRTNMAVLKVENFWTAKAIKNFGDYYLFVKAQGVENKILIQHRAYLPMPSGHRPGGLGFIYSTQGIYHYGFICEQPPSSDVGWIKYPYGTLANTSDSAYRTCFYRILDNQQVDDYNRKMYENMPPSIGITCPTSSKAGQKISCGVHSHTPYSMKGEDTWMWTVDGENISAGKSLVVNSPKAGTYKVQVLAQSNSGSVVKSNVVTVTITP